MRPYNNAVLGAGLGLLFITWTTFNDKVIAHNPSLTSDLRENKASDSRGNKISYLSALIANYVSTVLALIVLIKTCESSDLSAGRKVLFSGAIVAGDLLVKVANTLFQRKAIARVR